MNKSPKQISQRRRILISAAVVVFGVSLAFYFVSSTQETDMLKGAPNSHLSNSGVPVLDGPLVGVHELTQQKIYCNILAAGVKESLNRQHLKFEGGIEMCLGQDGKVLGVDLRPAKEMDTNSSKLVLANLRLLKFPAFKVDAFGLARTYDFKIRGNSVKCELLQAPIQKTK
jgi:hypothetical protein